MIKRRCKTIIQCSPGNCKGSTSKLFTLCMVIFCALLFTACEEELFEMRSELPESLIGYQIVLYNTEVVENPDDLYVSSRTVYYFEDEDTIRGEGDDGSSVPTTSWDWTGGDPEEIVNVEILNLFYGENGRERFIITWDGYEEALENRQTFTANYVLAGYGVVVVKGYFEIERR